MVSVVEALEALPDDRPFWVFSAVLAGVVLAEGAEGNLVCGERLEADVAGVRLGARRHRVV